MKSISPVPLHKLVWLIMLFLVDCNNAQRTYTLDENEACFFGYLPGTCQTFANCPILRAAYYAGSFSVREAVHCGFTVREELICCPVRLNLN